MVDDAVIAYVEWREECIEVWNAYGWWASAPPEDVRRAHASYRAALDREEAASKVYAGLMKRVGQPRGDRLRLLTRSWRSFWPTCMTLASPGHSGLTLVRLSQCARVPDYALL